MRGAVFNLRKLERPGFAEQTGDLGFVGFTFRKMVSGSAGAVDAVVFQLIFRNVAGGRALENGGAAFGNFLVIGDPGVAAAVFARHASVTFRFHVAPDRIGEIDHIVESRLFYLRQNHRRPSPHAVVIIRSVAAVIGEDVTVEVDVPRRKTFVRVFVRLHCQSNILHVACALHTTSRFARRLNGGEKQTD